MSVASNNEGKKWIQTSVAVICILLGYILVSFFEKLGEWFVLESKIPYYYVITQAISVVLALVAYVVTMVNPKSSSFLASVFEELKKVVWPDKNQTWKHTIIIMIGVTIMGFVFGFFDFGANFLLGLVNK